MSLRSWLLTKDISATRSWRILPYWAFALTYPSRRVAAGSGKASTARATLSMVIGDGFAEPEADACCASAVSAWSAPSHMHTKQEDFAGYTCRGHSNILKRVLIHTAALNLGLLMRLLVG